ncbi:uroporphyrinogen decarboxylase family protein [Mahella australiensis]|uniref:uroporphyrinogen decarboxylase family protein n=1 Tax=Mahella australiensis TaxID=252966 RepID=UPI0002F55F4E|nr:uroporphyrinogen decarboxylase family protein [Mahella australiensis]
MLTYTDIAYKNGPIFSPTFLRKEFFPRLKRLNDTYHEAGVKCLFHSDGNLMPIMDDLVAAGIDGINPMEVIAGMSIKEVRQRYGHKIFITGGIDVSQLMAFGTPEEVRQACVQAIEYAGGIGYFLGSTTELHPDIPAENILAMVEVAHTYKIG